MAEGRAAAAVDVAAGVSEEERRFLAECVRIAVPPVSGPYPDRREREAEDEAVALAVQRLEQHHVVILDNALGAEELRDITGEWRAQLDTKNGDSAIGEKAASNRSATRMYNCKCQVGPACTWSGWKPGSARTRLRLHPDGGRAKPWERVCAHWGFDHIKRVEVVTSHPGCRAQGWHVDAVHGLTAIFPLVDVDVRKGSPPAPVCRGPSLHPQRPNADRPDDALQLAAAGRAQGEAPDAAGAPLDSGAAQGGLGAPLQRQRAAPRHGQHQRRRPPDPRPGLLPAVPPGARVAVGD